MTESPSAPTSLAPFIIRNFIIPLIIFTNKSLLNLTHKFKPLEIIRYTIVTAILFFIKIIPSFILPALNPNSNFNPNFNSHSNSSSNSESDSEADSGNYLWVPLLRGSGKGNDAGDTCIARALSQLLAIINEIPVSSRKYEIVRSYAEKLMDENLEEGYEPLRRVNATVLSAAFARALGQLETAVAEAPAPVPGESSDEDVVKKSGYFGLNRVMNAVGCFGGWTGFAKRKTRLGGSAEKLSAELLWLAQKLAACGSADEAVRQWASASKLASMSFFALPRLQGSLVKLSVFLFKQAVCMGGEDDEEGTVEELRKIKMKMLMSWLPLLCRSSIGTDAPVLSFKEKAELENVLGELIGSLKHEEQQEKVLSLWVHHFTHCPSSDWPNLHLYYARWCTTSRKLLIHDGK